jgi:hypothetical protein
MDNKFKKNKYKPTSNERFLTLKHLEDNELIKNYYLIKRIHLSNAVQKKICFI